ncbi:hypothetical protein TH9_10240 [Thalassospira xiamenensis]|uniref:hypothetical protein n=1 Tax=Thalassospira xiamenensis TaxID=220697 RepID=UPI000DEE0CF0|nr:hypothetical protein [Thalassospira xiamenensis]RCK33273.1 hypothetical protein TH9_10240 [Thalassospira xiamenensis]
MLNRSHIRYATILIATVLSGVGILAFSSPNSAALELKVTGPEKIIFDSDVAGCDSHHLPDAPARAFRDDRGRMILFAPNFQNRAFVGYGFDSLKPDCDSRFMAAGKAQPDLLDDRTWIHAIYTKDGRNVYALGSASFMPYRHEMPCKGRTKRIDCWINGLVTLKSTDGGKTFDYLGQPPHHAPFPPPEPYRDDRKRAPSYVTVTNIINWQNYLYAIVWRREEEWKNSRNCLVRAPANDPSSWQVWDGNDFIEAANLTDQGWQVQQTDCARVGPKGITSIRGFVRHEGTNTFIAIYQHRQRNKDGTDRHGMFYSTSPDMKNWSEPKFLLDEDLDPDAGPGDPFAAYATMIDEDSQDRLFSTIDDEASLVFVRLIPKPHNGKWRVPRQLVRFPVSITK